MWKNITIAACVILALGYYKLGQSSNTRKNMKHIEVALASVPTKMDPMKIWNYHHFMIVQSLYATLVRLNEEGRLVSYLAKNWTVNNDYTRFELNLNENAKFTDGSPIRSSDVAYSLARHAWPNSPSVIKGYLIDTILGMKDLKENEIPIGIETPTDHKVVIKLPEPYTPFLHLLAMPGFSIVSKKDVALSSGPMTGSFNDSTKTWQLKSREDYFGKKSNLKSMNIRQIKDLDKVSEAFSKNEIDISMGFVVGELDELTLPEGINIRTTDTLSYNHFFYNLGKKYFKNDDFRKDLGRLIQNIAWSDEFSSKYQEPLSTFLPVGVMGARYYEKDLSSFDMESFKNRWKDHIASETIKIVVIDKHFKKSFLIELESRLKNLGFKVNLIRSQGHEFMDTIKTKDYHIISGPYIGNYPDPDGFLEPLNPESAINLETDTSNGLFSKVKEVKHIADKDNRLEAYSKLIRGYENSWAMIPLYRVNFPIIFNKNLKVPDSSYRYEAELWNIFWN